MVGPLARNVHEARAQPLLSQAKASTHAERTLILGAHAHLDPMQAQLPHHQIKDKGRAQGPQPSSCPIRHNPVAQHPRRHRAPMDVRNAELPDEATVDSDAKNQPGPLAVVAISATHVLGEGGNMLERVRGQSRLPRAQPVPVSAAHSIKVAVLLAEHGADDELPRIRATRRVGAQKTAPHRIRHAQREHLDIAPPHARGAPQQTPHSRTRHCKVSPTRTFVTSSGTTASALESASAESSNEAGVPMTEAL